MKLILQKRWSWGLMTFFALGIAIVSFVPYATFNRENFAPVFEGRFPDMSVIWLYIHVFTAVIALLIGPFQFWKWLRNEHKTVHRWLGRMYMFAGVFPSAIAGIVIAQGTVSGLQGTIGFSLLGIFWFITGALALYSIINKRVQTHRRWMIRNFALTMAAVTLRLWIPILIIILVPMGIDPEESFDIAYKIVPWLSWIPNLIIAEIIIRVLMPSQQQSTLVFSEGRL